MCCCPAGELYRAATNASFGIGDAGGRTKQLLSFEIEPAGALQTLDMHRALSFNHSISDANTIDPSGLTQQLLVWQQLLLLLLLLSSAPPETAEMRPSAANSEPQASQ